MIARIRLVIGVLLLAFGAAAVAMNARVLSTFMLEVVVSTLDLQKAQELAPYDFSWGTMYWGNMLSDFTMLGWGLVLIGVVQFVFVRELADFEKLAGATDPARIAGLFSHSLWTMLAATPLLLLNGILSLVATVLPDRR